MRIARRYIYLFTNKYYCVCVCMCVCVRACQQICALPADDIQAYTYIYTQIRIYVHIYCFPIRRPIIFCHVITWQKIKNVCFYIAREARQNPC
jgi:hypothetical protein